MLFLEVSENSLDHCPVIFHWFGKNRATLPTAYAISGCVQVDRYSKIPTADWYSASSASSHSSVDFFNLKLVLTGVIIDLDWSIPNFSSMASVYSGCPIQTVPFSWSWMIWTPRKWFNSPRSFMLNFVDKVCFTSSIFLVLSPPKTISST